MEFTCSACQTMHEATDTQVMCLSVRVDRCNNAGCIVEMTDQRMDRSCYKMQNREEMVEQVYDQQSGQPRYTMPLSWRMFTYQLPVAQVQVRSTKAFNGRLLVLQKASSIRIIKPTCRLLFPHTDKIYHRKSMTSNTNIQCPLTHFAINMFTAQIQMCNGFAHVVFNTMFFYSNTLQATNI